MKVALKVTDTNQNTREVVAQFADFIAWETENNRSLATFEADMKLRDLCWLAWHTEFRNKVTVIPFDQWLNDVALIEPVADGNVIVPLESQAHIG
jgi:hypothetical protein